MGAMTGFPTQMLIHQPLSPMCVLALAYALEKTGNRFNSHGEVALVVAATLVAGVIALWIEGFAVPRAWRLLKSQVRSAHTPVQCIVFAYGAGYLLITTIGLGALLTPPLLLTWER